MADELIRYNRIKSYILQPQTFLSFGNIGYNLRENEIIMLQSLLTQDYFETLVPAIINKYVKYNSYDETEPIITQKYDNLAIKDIKDINTDNCIKTVNNKISSIAWQKCFPGNFNEIAYSKTIYCTFDCIIDIIEKTTGQRLEMNVIKTILFDEYKKYLTDFTDKIIDILIIEGKKHLGDKVRANFLTFAEFLYNDNYFLTTLDLWLLVNKYKVSTIFISSKNLLQANYDNNIFVAYSKNVNIREEKFCFIVIPALQSENIPAYKIIQNNKNDIFISLNEINIGNKNEECVSKIINAIENKVVIDLYLETFKKISKRKKKLYIEPDEFIEEDKVAKNINELDVEGIKQVEKDKEEAIVPKKKMPKKINKLLILDDAMEIKPENLIIIPKKISRKVKQVVLKGQRGGNKTRKTYE
jgi:hypothetical protein